MTRVTAPYTQRCPAFRGSTSKTAETLSSLALQMFQEGAKHLASKLGPTCSSKLLVPQQGTLRLDPSASLSGNIWQVGD